MATAAPRAGLRVVGPGARGPLEPGRLVSHATAALDVVVAAVGAPVHGAVGTVASGIRSPMAPGTFSAAASDALGACYLDLWICDRLLRHDGGNRSAAARCLVPVLLLEGVGGIAPVLGARLHRPDAVAVEYRRRRRVLVRAVRERSPQTWERLGHRLARIATGEDRLARPLTPVRGRGLPQPLSELVGLLEAERRELAVAGAESVGQELSRALLERCALLTAAAACLDGWQEAGPHRDGPERHRTAGPGIGRDAAWPTTGYPSLPVPGGGAGSASGSCSGFCGGGCPVGYGSLPVPAGSAHSASGSSSGDLCGGGVSPVGHDALPVPAGSAPSASDSSPGLYGGDCPAHHHHPRPRHSAEPHYPSSHPSPHPPPHPSSRPAVSLGVSVRRARLCGALYRIAVRLDLRVSDVARTAWRADVLRCAVA